ncbi:MAG: ATP:cob(I)alamin adenosyltransferase [Planctomycetaceae bacterium]|nr:ATP:cob(I)alamin adenosyltransferase [Planctomycetaceae bacterium]
MKIYTKTGDTGETGLFAGPRVAKDDLRIEAYGTVDELNAFLGVSRAACLPQEVDSVVERIQHTLLSLGAELATPNPVEAGTAFVNETQLNWLERTIDEQDQQLAPLRQFILPAGTPAASALHVARGVCRRAERRVVSLQKQPGNESVTGPLQYLNRLGDLLFVLARRANSLVGQVDVVWDKPSTDTNPL